MLFQEGGGGPPVPALDQGMAFFPSGGCEEEYLFAILLHQLVVKFVHKNLQKPLFSSFWSDYDIYFIECSENVCIMSE